MVELLRTRSIALVDVVDQVERVDPAKLTGDVFTYVDLGSVDQHRKIIRSAKLISIAEAPSRARQRLKTNDVLVSTVRPNLNGVARVPATLDSSIASTGFCVLRPKVDELDPHYLFHWVQSPEFVHDMMGKATGASYPAISDKIVLGSYIPFPSIKEQRRIAIILDKADELRVKRREAVAHLDSVAQSIFDTMVGDPVTNSRAWPQQKLNTLGRIATGNTPSRGVPENFGDYLEWIKTDNINTPEAIVTPAREGLSEQGARKARIVQSGSVLVTCIAGSPGVIGNVALTDRTVAFNQQINAFSPNSGPHLYWYALLKSMKPLVQKASSGGMKGLVSKSALSAIDTIVVPEAIQIEVAERLTAVERLKVRHRAQLAELEALVASLQHQAFRGEL